MERESQEALRGLEQFCARVSEGIDVLTFDERLLLLRLLVEPVRVDDNLVTVETIIPGDPQPGELCTRHPKPPSTGSGWRQKRPLGEVITEEQPYTVWRRKQSQEHISLMKQSYPV